MSDQTPEARAVDFHDAGINALWDEAVQQRLGEAGSVLIRTVMPKMQAALDERAADLALAAAVRRLEATGREWSIEARPMTYHVWTGVFGDPTTIAPTLIEAIEEALAAKEAERE